MSTETPFALQCRIVRDFAAQVDSDLEAQVLTFLQSLDREEFPRVSDDVRVSQTAQSRMSRWAVTLPKSGPRDHWDDNEELDLQGALKRLFREATFDTSLDLVGSDDILNVLFDSPETLEPNNAYQQYLAFSAEVRSLQDALFMQAAPQTEADFTARDAGARRLEEAQQKFMAFDGKTEIEDALAALQRQQNESALATFANILLKIETAKLGLGSGFEYLSVITEPDRFDPIEDRHWTRRAFTRSKSITSGNDTRRVDPLFECDTIEMELSALQLIRPWFDPKEVIRDDYGYSSDDFQFVSDGSRFRRPSLIPGYVEGLVLARRAAGLRTQTRPDPREKADRISMIEGVHTNAKSDTSGNFFSKAKQFGAVKGGTISLSIQREAAQAGPTTAIYFYAQRIRTGTKARVVRGALHIKSDAAGRLKIPLLMKRGTEGGRDSVMGSLLLCNRAIEPHTIKTDRLQKIHDRQMAPRRRTRAGLLNASSAKGRLNQAVTSRRRPLDGVKPASALHAIPVRLNRRFDIEIVAQLPGSRRDVPIIGARLQIEIDHGAPEMRPGLVGQAVSDASGRISGFIPVAAHAEKHLTLRIDAEGYRPVRFKLGQISGTSPFKDSFTLKPELHTGVTWSDKNTTRIVGVLLGRLPTLPK